MPGIKKYSLEDIRSRSGGCIGARRGDILVSLSPTYQGIKIQIYEDQDEPRQISRFVKGKFKLLSAGKGKYMDCLLNLIGRIFTSEILRKEVNHLEIELGNKATYTYGTEQNIMGILCPSCNEYQTSLDSCQCGYVRMM